VSIRKLSLFGVSVKKLQEQGFRPACGGMKTRSPEIAFVRFLFQKPTKSIIGMTVSKARVTKLLEFSYGH
jgi:hypothetical protein